MTDAIKDAAEIARRRAIAEELITLGEDETDFSPFPVDVPELLLAAPTDVEALQYPPNLAPVPKPLPTVPKADAPLPKAHVVIVTWTVAELNALADILTPRYVRAKWYRYANRFNEHYKPLIRAGAPSLKANRLGSYFMTRIGTKDVLCFKSELHLNQDGIERPEGTTLPVKDLFRQIIEEAKPQLVITAGTAGGVYLEQNLGDVVVTRGAKFRLSDEFKNAPFKSAAYTSDWEIPVKHIETAVTMMRSLKKHLVEPKFGPPTKRNDYEGQLIESWENNPDIWIDGVRPKKNGAPVMKRYHPILTTDFFEFGTSGNKMELEGCGVEMGDAVLGMVCDEMKAAGKQPPKWVVVRNMSDPQINADLPTDPRALNMQTHWAVWYYEKYGYWTSVNSSLACWAIVAGFEQ